MGCVAEFSSMWKINEDYNKNKKTDCNCKHDCECDNKVNSEEKKTIDLTAKWIQYVVFLKIMFEREGTKILYNDEAKKVDIYVEDVAMAYAFSALLPPEKTFGNITLTINVIPANAGPDSVELFKIIFKDNPLVNDIITIQPEGTNNPFTYILFDESIVEYWNDNLGNPHGLSFALYQDIAEEIFDSHDGVFFTTQSE